MYILHIKEYTPTHWWFVTDFVCVTCVTVTLEIAKS